MSSPSSPRWTGAGIKQDVFDAHGDDPKAISYCLRLLKKEGVLAAQAESINPILLDMAGKLAVSPRLVLTEKQTPYAVSLMKKARLQNNLAVIFNMMEARGEELTFDEMDHDPVEPLRDPEPGPDPDSPSAGLSRNWGMF